MKVLIFIGKIFILYLISLQYSINVNAATVPKQVKDGKINGDITHDDNKEPEIPCTATSPITNGFYDLRHLASLDVEEKLKVWNAKGYDYGMDFSLGICSSPLKEGQTVADIKPEDIKSVGGYYTDIDDNKYSIGKVSTGPIFRGKKLIIEYKNGSYCRGLGKDGKNLRKSTILSFTCDRDIMIPASVSFIGVLHDCDYYFDVRTIYACATAHKEDNVALVWIVIIIIFAALLVYCSGGILYQRMVLNKRGWRQMPNYGFLKGIKRLLSLEFLRNVSSKVRGRNPSGNNNYSYNELEEQNDLLDSLSLDVESDSSF